MDQMKKQPTIKDVAKAAGVSIQTVSRVINNRPDVASETRKRIQRIITEVDYRPNAIARSLSTQRTYNFGLVTSGLEFIGPSVTLSGIADKSEQLGYGPFSERSSQISFRQRAIFTRLVIGKTGGWNHLGGA